MQFNCHLITFHKIKIQMPSHKNFTLETVFPCFAGTGESEQYFVVLLKQGNPNSYLDTLSHSMFLSSKKKLLQILIFTKQRQKEMGPRKLTPYPQMCP